MNASPPSCDSAPSGLSILLHTRLWQALCHLWLKINGVFRPFLPLLHLALLFAIRIILCAVVFANQHLPTWYDETCLTDPAFYQATHGVWKSRMELDSLGIEPFAVKYPLLIGHLWLLTKLFGMDYAWFRISILFWGLLPVVGFLWLSRKRGLLRSWVEIIQATYFWACFGLFYWGIFIRPEAMILSVGFFLALFWFSKPVWPLFATALCIPLCGLHWDVVILPALLAWLVWGGDIRKPLAIAGGALLGTIAVLLWYHLAGMWPSYLLEAHRFTSPNILGNIRRFIYEMFLSVRFDHLLLGDQFPFNVFLCFLLVFGGGGQPFVSTQRLAPRKRKYSSFSSSLWRQ